MYDAARLAVPVELVDAGHLDAAGRRAGQMTLRPGRASVGHPDVQFHLVALQNAQAHIAVAELRAAEHVFEEGNGPPLIGDGQ